ncbi:MAG: GNAT family protein [Candidatus Jorgensenbacteria bacterium]|nr:GNAT family protein [Candidatus Jorgensenbacteria bacterium]
METNNSIQFLRGKKVTLRPVVKEDVPRFLVWINDPDVRQYLSMYLPVMEADEQAWFENLSKSKETDIVFLIIADDQPIGCMGIHRINWKDKTAITGAFIGEKKYWGKGYGTEAKMLLLNYAFNSLNLRKVCASVLSFNGRSHAYQLKCGYKEEGRRKQQVYKNGRYWDEIFTAVFKKDWLPLWRKYRKTNLR